MGESLITVDRIKDIVKQKKLNTRIEEEEWRQQLRDIHARVASRDLLIANYDEKNAKRQTRAKLLLEQ